MPLLQFWKTAKDEVLKLTIEQVVSNAGDGILNDQSLWEHTFDSFLKRINRKRRDIDGLLLLGCLD